MNIKTWKSEIIHCITNKPIKKGSYKDFYTLTFNKNGNIHNDEFPAVAKYKYGVLIELMYYSKDNLHRDPYDGIDRPAIINFRPDSSVYLVKYYINGILYRNPINGVKQPVIIYYDLEDYKIEIYGNMKTYTRIAYYLNNTENGDIKNDIKNNIKYNIKYKIYYVDGLIHRDSKPAVFKYNEDGTLQKERYYNQGIKRINI